MKTAITVVADLVRSLLLSGLAAAATVLLIGAAWAMTTWCLWRLWRRARR